MQDEIAILRFNLERKTCVTSEQPVSRVDVVGHDAKKYRENVLFMTKSLSTLIFVTLRPMCKNS